MIRHNLDLEVRHKLDLRNKRYSEKELEDNCHLFDKVDWYDISEFQELSGKFIEKHSGKVSWGGISFCQKLSDNFIKKHIEKIDIYWLLGNENISEKTKEEIKTLKEII
jgi:hypothetical protein